MQIMKCAVSNPSNSLSVHNAVTFCKTKLHLISTTTTFCLMAVLRANLYKLTPESQTMRDLLQQEMTAVLEIPARTCANLQSDHHHQQHTSTRGGAIYATHPAISKHSPVLTCCLILPAKTLSTAFIASSNKL